MQERIRKARLLRLYPTKAQRELLAINFGHARFVYNHFLKLRTDLYANEKKSLSFFQCVPMLTALKHEHEWLYDANAQVLQVSLKHLQSAYDGFFVSRKGFPQFKSRRHRQAITFPQSFSIRQDKLHLPALGLIKTRGRLPLADERITSATVSFEHGKYFVSLAIDAPAPAKFEPIDKAVGVDLGFGSFIATSDGEKVENPRHLKRASKRLRRLQRSHSRKKLTSNNRKRSKLKLSRQHEKVTNQRKDFHHKLSLRLLRENQTVVLEDLNIKGMQRGHFGKSVSDTGWGNFMRMLEYKADWYGRRIERCDRFFPSSKRCHCCGHINENLKLHHRKWVCSACGVTHDRDVNAAKNILQFSSLAIGMGNTQNTGRLPEINACGDSQESLKQEQAQA